MNLPECSLPARRRVLADADTFPALLRPDLVRPLWTPEDGGHAPRILMLYGSLRERSYSRLVSEEAARLLQLCGAEVRIFDPSDLPFPDQVGGDDHPAVHELRQLSLLSEG